QSLITRSLRFGGQQLLNLLLLAAALTLGALVAAGVNSSFAVLTGFFVVALVLGISMTLPIGGADMPVVISLYNALTGLAVGLEGFVLENAAMIIASTVVGSAGTLLTQLMAKAMNRSLGNVLFSGFGDTGGPATGAVTGSLKPIEASDVGVMLAFAQKVIVVPRYGMAVARTDKSSPIYGMPILNADKAKNVIVIKRGQGAGFSGIENALFYLDNTRMLYGDAQKAGAALIQAIKAVG